MTVFFTFLGMLCAILFVYLLAALLKPEMFP